MTGQKRYFSSLNGRMIVIDPVKPKTNLIDKYNAEYIAKGVTNIAYKEYLDLISDDLKIN